jgi:hypothetical protein
LPKIVEINISTPPLKAIPAQNLSIYFSGAGTPCMIIPLMIRLIAKIGLLDKK